MESQHKALVTKKKEQSHRNPKTNKVPVGRRGGKSILFAHENVCHQISDLLKPTKGLIRFIE
jgi:hypothetical protein